MRQCFIVLLVLLASFICLSSTGSGERPATLVEVVPTTASSTCTINIFTTPMEGTEGRPTVVKTEAPIQKLSEDDAIALVYRLLETNKGCSLPCWWGITPGETRWEESYSWLISFSSRWEGREQWLEREGESYRSGHFTFYFDFAREKMVLGISTWDGIVREIYPGDGLSSWYTLDVLLNQAGPPDRAFIEAFSHSPEPYLPFRLILYYERGIVAFYEAEAEVRGNKLGACFREIVPCLYLWPADPTLSSKQLLDIVLGVGDHPALTLEQATSMDTQTFYRAYRDEQSGLCIETPAELWP